MRTKIFYVGERIVLKGECIVAFRTLSKETVECHIESRSYDTVYKLKPVETHCWRRGSKEYFIQVCRKK